MDYPRFYGRELSWLQFNERVLEEVTDPNNPLLEQLRFLGIVSSNLDEYFMIRVSGMKGQVDLGLTNPDKKTGYTPKEYLKKILHKSKEQVEKQYKIYHQKIKELNTYISFTTYEQLSKKHKEKMDSYFDNLIFPILTPITFSSHLPFPLLPNLSVYLISRIETIDQEKYSVVTVPPNVERVVHVKKDKYVLLEDIIIHNIEKLYEGQTISEVVPFRITRDFDIEFDDHSDDFAQAVTNELKERKRGAAIRLEIANQVSEETITFLTEHINITKKFIFKIEGPLDLRFLEEIYETVKTKVKGLVYHQIAPIEPSVFQNSSSIFDVISKKDVMLFHPHHSYEPVIRLLQEAANDDNVVAIKQTIYRTTKDSNIMKALVKAAERGVQVTVLFELKARFDEENNLFWGNQLERSGAHVIYGVPKLKTHTKMLLIVRRTKNLVERFLHVSTGNYNEQNAKIYTDVSYFTAKKIIGNDATKFFNYISSFGKKPVYKKLVASPNSIQEEFTKRIRNEIKQQKNHQNGHLIFKMNAITDIEMMNELYNASQYGVKIDLIVRGSCCINPGIKHLSENIRVISIVGRYLEHMRIYYFNNNNKNDIFISSADLMTRNMKSRIEIALPITDRSSKRKLIHLLKLQLNDNQKARENVQSNYHYVKDDKEPCNAQLELYKHIK